MLLSMLSMMLLSMLSMMLLSMLSMVLSMLSMLLSMVSMLSTMLRAPPPALLSILFSMSFYNVRKRAKGPGVKTGAGEGCVGLGPVGA